MPRQDVSPDPVYTAQLQRKAFNALDAAACALVVLTNEAGSTGDHHLMNRLNTTLNQLDVLMEEYDPDPTTLSSSHR